MKLTPINNNIDYSTLRHVFPFCLVSFFLQISGHNLHKALADMCSDVLDLNPSFTVQL